MARTIPRLFSFKGRLNRKAYTTSVFIGFSLSLAFFFLLGAISKTFGTKLPDTFVAILGLSFFFVNIPLFIFALAAQVRRLHDLNRPGWHALMDFIPLANIYFNFQLFLQKGTSGPNQYGPDPLDTSAYAPPSGSADAFAVSAALHEKNGDLALARADYETFLLLASPDHPARPIIERRLAVFPK